jgi:hypothetical protein
VDMTVVRVTQAEVSLPVVKVTVSVVKVTVSVVKVVNEPKTGTEILPWVQTLWAG